jgi:hypothetical protein
MRSSIHLPLVAALIITTSCMTTGLAVVQAQSGSSLPASGEATQPSTKQTVDFLSTTLTGECGRGTAFSESAEWAVQSKVTNVQVIKGTLTIERTSAVQMEQVHPSLRQADGTPRVLRVRLEELWADAEPVTEGARRANGYRGPGLLFECQRAGCVIVDGAAGSYLEIPVCPEKLTSVLNAMQTLILQAGGRRKPGLNDR